MAKINVIFNDSSNEIAGSQPQSEDGQVTGQKEKTASYLIGQAVVQQAKRTLNYGASMVGNLTGNYILQNKIDNAVTFVGYAGEIISGFATGGKIGGIVSIIAVAGQIGTSAFSYETDKAKADAQAQYLRNQRGGLLNDYSR